MASSHVNENALYTIASYYLIIQILQFEYNSDETSSHEPSLMALAPTSLL